MAAGLALGAVQTLLAALQCTELVNLSTIFNYRSKLNDLKRTVETIKAVLLDADSKHQALTEAGRDWVEKLKHAVYKADDLFDELITRAQQNKLSKGKISKKEWFQPTKPEVLNIKFDSVSCFESLVRACSSGNEDCLHASWLGYRSNCKDRI